MVNEGDVLIVWRVFPLYGDASTRRRRHTFTIVWSRGIGWVGAPYDIFFAICNMVLVLCSFLLG